MHEKARDDLKVAASGTKPGIEGRAPDLMVSLVTPTEQAHPSNSQGYC